jgi:hypothetical protein
MSAIVAAANCNPAVASRLAKYDLSQVLDRGAQMIARGAETLPQQEKNNSVGAQQSRVNFARVKRWISGCALSWLLPTAARR